MARYLLRQPQFFPSLVLSAWLVLIYNPRQLFDLGFQLSYGVVSSIILVGLPMAQCCRVSLEGIFSRIYPRKRWQDLLGRLIQSIADLACVSISAGMASMPLIVQHFGLFAPGGILLGILLNPLASLTVMLGCLVMLTGIAIGNLPAGWIAMATWPGIRLMESMIAVCLRIPGAVSERHWPWPPTGTVLLMGALILAWWLQWMRQNGKALPPATVLLPLAVILAGLSLASIGA